MIAREDHGSLALGGDVLEPDDLDLLVVSIDDEPEKLQNHPVSQHARDGITRRVSRDPPDGMPRVRFAKMDRWVVSAFERSIDPAMRSGDQKQTPPTTRLLTQPSPL